MGPYQQPGLPMNMSGMWAYPPTVGYMYDDLSKLIRPNSPAHQAPTQVPRAGIPVPNLLGPYMPSAVMPGQTPFGGPLMQQSGSPSYAPRQTPASPSQPVPYLVSFCFWALLGFWHAWLWKFQDCITCAVNDNATGFRLLVQPLYDNFSFFKMYHLSLQDWPNGSNKDVIKESTCPAFNMLYWPCSLLIVSCTVRAGDIVQNHWMKLKDGKKPERWSGGCLAISTSFSALHFEPSLLQWLRW